MTPRKICVVTGSRAEYGLLFWLMSEIRQDPALQLQLLVTGMHLSPEFGLTFRRIEEDGFAIDAKVEMMLSGDSATSITKSMGVGLMGCADALARLAPDVVVVFGDRYEVFAAAQAAMMARIPLAHISGGEVTEGGIDDAVRHCLTKMSYFHFVSADAYRRRVIQMGESPDRVWNCGDPGVENMQRMTFLTREALSKAIGWDVTAPFFLCTYHPETLTGVSPREVMTELFAALDAFPDYRVLITKSNADEGGRLINQLLDEYGAAQPDRIRVSVSLGQGNYSSAMRHCAAVVGNSSSGLVEAPALCRPTVNIGDRQAGRLMATSVVSCVATQEAITAAIGEVLSQEFQQRLPETQSLYGLGHTAAFIKEQLKMAELTGVVKRFYEGPVAS